jgi:reverse gyrase
MYCGGISGTSARNKIDWVCPRCLRQQSKNDRRCWACAIIRQHQRTLHRAWEKTLKERRRAGLPWQLARGSRLSAAQRSIIGIDADK